MQTFANSQDSSENLAYSYDADDQLLGASDGEAYTYDANGNRATTGGTSSTAIGPDNEVTQENGVTYTYDADGNLIEAETSPATTRTTPTTIATGRQAPPFTLVVMYRKRSTTPTTCSTT